MHLIIILVVALLILGPGKLPETGEALGKAIREFRRAVADEPSTASRAAGRASAEHVDATPGRPPSNRGSDQDA
jgi:TatA/E family protein of Tat protein translocase